ncbi:MAG: hypothetical protein OXE43_01285 [Chloroflexi bacterium]|nr:hypothetical protein [Chloroflexota bacterium]
MGTSDERTALRDLLSAIQLTSAIRPDDTELQNIESLVQRLAFPFSVAQDDYFEDRISVRKDTVNLSMVRDGQYLYLRSPRREQHILPLMAVDAKVTKRSSSVKVQVALFHKGKEGESIGYRFEYGRGSHKMLHCQHVTSFTSFDGKRVPLPEAPNWIPTTQPSFPLDGKSGGIHCILAAYISIYGLDELVKIVGNAYPSLKQDMKELHCNPFQ